MAQRVDITLDQGATFEFSFNVNDANGATMDLDGYTARAQMRKHYTSTNATSFTCNVEANAIILSLTANQTANIAGGRYVYDVEMVDTSNVVSRAMEGVVTINPNVTRD